MAAVKTIDVKGQRYNVYEFVGTVASADKQLETVVSGSAVTSDGMGNVRGGGVSSTTHTHDRLFLIDSTGKERAFNFTNVHINARTGHSCQVLWLVKEGDESGNYVFVKNLTTDEQRWIDDGLKHTVVFFYGNGYYILPFVLAVIFLAFFTMGLSLLGFYWGNRYIKTAVSDAKQQLTPLIKS